jgi:RNA-directed DNA polymerase
MSSYQETRADLVEFQPKVKYELPLAICDRSLSYHLGIHNRTLWFFLWQRDKLYATFSIDKRGKSKGKRGIQNPDKRLKRVQKVFLTRFLHNIPTGEHIGAYVPGRSCLDTARQHVKSAVIVSMDIRDFFPTVKRAMIRRYLLGLGYNHRVASLMAALVTYRNFLPQGAPTSGMVANLVADQRFDQAILQDLRKFDSKWRYTRYSDDIDVSHPEKQPRERILEVVNIVRSRVSEAGFHINERKTKTEPYWNRQKVLGVVVNEKPNVPRLEYMRIKAMIHNCMMHGFESQTAKAKKENAGMLVSHIRGKLAFFKQIDKHKADILKRKFEIALEMHSDEVKDEVDFGTDETS